MMAMDQDVTHLLPFLLFFCLFLPLGLAAFGLWIWALIDVLTHEFEGNDKVIWILVIIFLNWLGALLYLFIGRKHPYPPTPGPAPSPGPGNGPNPG